MMYLVYRGGELVGAFNEYNIFFIDPDIKMWFIHAYQENGFDSAIEGLKEKGYEVVEVLD